MAATLFRSRDQALIGGVCGGLGAFMGISPAYIRLFFVIIMFGNGIGAVIYLLLWIMIPLDGQVQSVRAISIVPSGQHEFAYQPDSIGDEFQGLLKEAQPTLWFLIGGGLILAGMFYLLTNLHLEWLNWHYFDLIWSLLMIFGGLAILFRRPKGVIR